MMTPDQIQDMINVYVAFAFTSMGINDQYTHTSLSTLISLSSNSSASISLSSWFLDFGALNHMNSVEQQLCGTKPYVRNKQIKAANGQPLSNSVLGFIEMFTFFHTYLQI